MRRYEKPDPGTKKMQTIGPYSPKRQTCDLRTAGASAPFRHISVNFQLLTAPQLVLFCCHELAHLTAESRKLAAEIVDLICQIRVGL